MGRRWWGDLSVAHCPETSSALLLGYQLGIGRDHFLTKELQRYIEGLKKRRSKRLYVN